MSNQQQKEAETELLKYVEEHNGGETAKRVIDHVMQSCGLREREDAKSVLWDLVSRGRLTVDQDWKVVEAA